MSVPPGWPPPSDDRPGGRPADPVWTVQGGWGHEPVAPRRRRRPFLAVVAVLVALAMVLATGAALFTTWTRSDGGAGTSVGRFLDHVERSESVMEAFQAGVSQARSPDDVREVAEAARPRLQLVRGQVARLDAGTSALAKAQEEYLAHADAWLTAMETVTQGREIDNTPQINRSFQEACDAMRGAARDGGAGRDLRRVERICAEPADGDGGSPSGPGDSIRA